jgi:ferredoxin
VDPRTLQTSAERVFVAGDLAHGTRLLIDAVASGKAAARSVYRVLTGRSLEAQALVAHLPLERYRRERGYESLRRVAVPVREAEERISGQDLEVELGFDEAQARREASRCLDCGVTPVFDGTRCVLCGGCVDVCPTQCLKLVALDELEGGAQLEQAAAAALGEDGDPTENSAILKDEDRCIRCALCAMRCPTHAIEMERTTFCTTWRSS